MCGILSIMKLIKKVKRNGFWYSLTECGGTIVYKPSHEKMYFNSDNPEPPEAFEELFIHLEKQGKLN